MSKHSRDGERPHNNSKKPPAVLLKRETKNVLVVAKILTTYTRLYIYHNRFFCLFQLYASSLK